MKFGFVPRIAGWMGAALLSMPGAAFAQGAPVASRPTPANIPTANPTNNVPPTSNLPDLYVTGKVIVQDGGELPPNVVIEKSCGNRRVALGYADHKGNFSVKLTGGSIASLLDASDDSRSINRTSTARQQGASNLLGCELQAAYSGYSSSRINIGTRRALDNPDVGTVVLRPNARGAGTMVSETMLTAPKDAIKAYDRGIDAERKGKAEIALKDFEKAVALHPRFAAAWYELGRLRMDGDPAAAQAGLEKAIAADPRYIPPYGDLAILAYRRKNWKETVDITNRGIRLDPGGTPQLYYFDAAAQFNMRNMDEAERLIRDAINIDVNRTLVKAPQLLSYILAAKGDIAGAAEQMRTYLAAATNPDEAERARKELGQMESRIGAASKK